MNPLSRQLEALGLSDKEAAVYVAALSLGASPVQIIAKKAEIKRATTYLIIADLTGKGLMSSVEKGKRTYYVAEDPKNLARILAQNEAKLSQQKASLADLIPELESLMKAGGERPIVRFYEGLEGIETIRQDFLDPKYTEVASMTNIDLLFKLFPRQNTVTAERVKRKIKSRVLYTSKDGPVEWMNDPKSFREARFVHPEQFSFEGDITIYGDKVSISSFHKKPASVVIEDPVLAQIMKVQFDLAWTGAKNVVK